MLKEILKYKNLNQEQEIKENKNKADFNYRPYFFH